MILSSLLKHFHLAAAAVILRQGFSVYPGLSWSLICRAGWPLTPRSTCLFLRGARIKGIHYHYPVPFFFSITLYLYYNFPLVAF